MKYIATWLGATIFFVILTGVNLHYALRIAHSGTQTEGTVVAWQPENHHSVLYQYTVNGRSHQASETVDEFPEIGKRVAVFYDRDAPDTSTLRSPHEAVRDARMEMISTGVFVGIIAPAFFLIVRSLNRRLRENK